MLKTGLLMKLSASSLGFVLACSNPTAPAFSIKFGTADLTSQSETASVSADVGEIVVTGKITIPDPCYSGAGSFDESGTTLTLHVTPGAHAGGGCATVIAYLAYTARIPATGTHEVVVIHESVGFGPSPREIARVQVTVP